jgi:hypothetical protein
MRYELTYYDWAAIKQPNRGPSIILVSGGSGRQARSEQKKGRDRCLSTR